MGSRSQGPTVGALSQLGELHTQRAYLRHTSPLTTKRTDRSEPPHRPLDVVLVSE